jgi:hypothetical protein
MHACKANTSSAALSVTAVAPACLIRRQQTFNVSIASNWPHAFNDTGAAGKLLDHG